MVEFAEYMIVSIAKAFVFLVAVISQSFDTGNIFLTCRH